MRPQWPLRNNSNSQKVGPALTEMSRVFSVTATTVSVRHLMSTLGRSVMAKLLRCEDEGRLDCDPEPLRAEPG